MLYLLLADGEGAPEIYLNACDKEQAGIIFEEAKRMVEASPSLLRRLEVINSKAEKRIHHPAGNGVIIANSSVAGSKDGLNPHAIIFDELHRQETRELWAVFEHAAVARDQPLTISITTAGESEQGVWHEQREYSDQVNAGEKLDIRHLGVVYRALADDDLDDPATWAKANPSIGATIKEQDFAAEWNEAKSDPAKRANFLRLRLNIIQAADTKFFAPGIWAQNGDYSVWKKGESCFAGLDLSSTDDLSALVLIFGDDDSGFDVMARFYLPKDNIDQLAGKHGQPYRQWADQGLITLTDGNVIDYGFIRRDINELAGDFDLKLLLVDPFNATKLMLDLAEHDGLPVKQLRQGFLSLSPPTKQLKRFAESKKLRHGNHPILRWMAGNAVSTHDDAENVKISKKKSKSKIDGIAALVNAIAGTMASDEETGGSGSVYDKRGLLVL